MMVWMIWLAYSLGAPAGCGDWVREPIPNLSGSIRNSVLLADESGGLHALWFSPQSGRSHYGRSQRGVWHVETLGRGQADLAVRDGIPFVAQTTCDSHTCSLSYGFKEEGVWTSREVLSMPGPLSAPSLDIGPDGLPHVAYVSTTGATSALMHATPADSVWREEVVEQGPTRYGQPDLVVQDNGELSVMITRSIAGGQVVLAKRNGKRWMSSVTTLGRGRDVKLTRSSMDALYAATFLDGQRMSVWIPSQGWVYYGDPISGTGVGAIASSGAPHFVVVKDARPLKRLQWVHWTKTGWVHELVAADPHGFSAVSFALDRSGCPHILYQHSNSQKTVYAHAKL